MWIEQYLSIEPFRWDAIVIALLCGGLIGLERQLHSKAAGIRTSILVCLGAYIFVSIAIHFQPGVGEMRVLGQIVTGIGFLGAGVMLSRNGSVHGVTSAAVIWILASIGCLIGFSYFGAALLMTLIILIILIASTLYERIQAFKREEDEE